MAKMTMGPSVKLIEDRASEAGKQVTIHSVLSADAFDCFLRGDMEIHDRIVKEAASGLTGKVGVVVLAQASMGHLAGAIEGILKVPVVTSPGLAIDALVRRVKEG
jgi:Asp/Glu/hydantoin racemase